MRELPRSRDSRGQLWIRNLGCPWLSLQTTSSTRFPFAPVSQFTRWCEWGKSPSRAPGLFGCGPLLSSGPQGLGCLENPAISFEGWVGAPCAGKEQKEKAVNPRRLSGGHFWPLVKYCQ